MLIDRGSCINVLSENAAKKLGLKPKTHPKPYKVAWVNKINLKIHEQCLFTNRFYCWIYWYGAVQCTFPQGLSIMGQPWLFQKNAQHWDFNNTYSFKLGSCEMKLMPTQDLSKLKFKRTIGSFLLKHAPSFGDGIHGPHPTSMPLRFSKGKRIDAAIIVWLDKYQTL